MEIRKQFALNNNRDGTYQYLGDAAKAVLRGERIILSVYSTKEEKLKHNLRKYHT